MLYRILLGIFVCALIVSCQPNKREMVNLPQDFVVFYDKFLSDSAYQMAHIQFPLEGIPSYADSLTVAEHTFRWQKADWELHQPFDEKSKDFERTFRQITDHVVEEVIIQRNGQLGTVRRFLKSGDDWMLIYFSGINAMQLK